MLGPSEHVKSESVWGREKPSKQSTGKVRPHATLDLLDSVELQNQGQNGLSEHDHNYMVSTSKQLKQLCDTSCYRAVVFFNLQSSESESSDALITFYRQSQCHDVLPLDPLLGQDIHQLWLSQSQSLQAGV